MHTSHILDRFRNTGWSWWALWLLCLLLLGSLVLKHPTGELRELAEHLRPRYSLLPLHIVIHRGLGTSAAYVLGFCFVLGLMSILRPQQGRILLPIAVGLVLLFFAYHTFWYSHMMTGWMRFEAAIPASPAGQ